jgi:hypothetical protein
MRAVLWVGGIVIFGFVIITIIPSFTVVNAGSATLAKVNGYSIVGTATLTPLQGGRSTIVDVQVHDLRPNATYALSIRSGSCYGYILTALQPAVTNYKGSGSSSTTLDAQLQSSWFIVLHNGPSTKNNILACGQVIISAVAQGSNTSNSNSGNCCCCNPKPPIPGQFPNTGGGPPKP